MRVTDRMFYDDAVRNSARAAERMQAANQRVGTGVRVNHPGDDPAAASIAVGQRLEEARYGAIQTACDRAHDELQIADGALEGLGNVLTRAREIATQLSNATYSADQRTVSASEVASLRQQAVTLLNTQAGDRFLFGGQKDGTPAFDLSGAYHGDDQQRAVEIAPGVYQPSSIRADVAAQGVGGGVDVLATLQDLQTALASNDVAAVQTSLDALALSVQQVAAARSQAGAAMSVFDAASAAAKSAHDAATTAASNVLDADAIESASELALSQHSLEAALSASAQSFRFSLLDRLR